MIALRQWSALILALVFAAALRADDKPPPSPWVVDRALTVSPAAAPVPALKYRLLPLHSELKEGNAIPIYLRLNHEQSDESRKYFSETPRAWNELPLDKMPLAEARAFVKGRRYMLRQLELGARRRTAEWNYTLDEPDPIGLLLPDVQWLRNNFPPMLLLQVRVALADGDFTAAAHHLETGFAYSQHMGEGPTLIHKLVGIAVAGQFAGTVADWVERPDAPNLYWALTALPRPLIDLRDAQEWEYRMLEMQFPDFDDLDRERTPEQWDAALRRFRTEMRRLAGSDDDKLKHPDWYPKDTAPDDPAAKSPDLPAARKFVARAKNLTAEKVEALAPAQVLLLYIKGTYQEDRDDSYRAVYLPYLQARPLFAAADKRLRELPTSEGHLPGRLFLPALGKVQARQNLLERNLAALRVVEAVRMYAAAHEGRLPEKLDDVTEVPLPDDPGTGKPFEYTRDGEAALVVSKVPDEVLSNSGIRFRVIVRKK